MSMHVRAVRHKHYMVEFLHKKEKFFQIIFYFIFLTYYMQRRNILTPILGNTFQVSER